jgi:hypothetical protein
VKAESLPCPWFSLGNIGVGLALAGFGLGTFVNGSAEDHPSIAKIRVHAGANASFPLYDDDGLRLRGSRVMLTQLLWEDAEGELAHTGVPVWTTARS